MTIRPILFSGPMVRALLHGQKTQTRRVLKDVPRFSMEHERQWNAHAIPPSGAISDEWSWWEGPSHGPTLYHKQGIPYAIGDLLYVREAWRTHHRFDATAPRNIQAIEGDVSFEADGPLMPAHLGRLRPGMHMPRWASRLTLKVTNVRVQRLQEISDEDAIAEGVDWLREHDRGASDAFSRLWDNLNHKRGYSWQVNPWVVAITFEVHHCNVDQFDRADAA